MSIVKFTYALKRFYPNLDDLHLDVENVSTMLEAVEKHYPGIKSYLVDDQGVLRQHVNIFVDGKMIDDRKNLSDVLEKNTEVYIMQALSGG